jgi:hypothetical protein
VGTSFLPNRFNNSNEKFGDQERCRSARKNTKRRRITMKSKGYLWFTALLIASALAFPPTATTAEKGGMMEDDKSKMMKEETDKKMKDAKGEMKDQKKDKATKSEDKMKMDDKMKMEEKKK